MGEREAFQKGGHEDGLWTQLETHHCMVTYQIVLRRMCVLCGLRQQCGGLCKHYTQKSNNTHKHDSVASVGSNFKSLTLGSLFQVYLSMEILEGKTFLVIINSILCVQ